MHLIPNGRAYHGIFGRISSSSVRFMVTVLAKKGKRKISAIGNMYSACHQQA